MVKVPKKPYTQAQIVKEWKSIETKYQRVKENMDTMSIYEVSKAVGELHESRFVLIMKILLADRK